MRFLDDGLGRSALFICAQFVPAASQGLMLIKRALTPTITNENFKYTESISDPLTVLDLLPLNINSIYILI
jgi:hypothetical protein